METRHEHARKYFDLDALLATVESGAIAPLRGRWLVEHCSRHNGAARLQRRQDLPPEAFFSAPELRAVAARLGGEWGRLFVALSYRWLTKDHPDPDGFHLAIVAQVAALYLKPSRASRGQAYFSPLVRAFTAAGLDDGAIDFALLWDYASLYQKPRRPTEVPLFTQGLRGISIWYGHEATACWMQTELPGGFEERMATLGLAQSYEASGWCFVEASMSAGIKPSTLRLDLGRRTERALGCAYGGDEWVANARLDRVCSSHRSPPLTPARVAALLRTSKIFTSPADTAVVGELYRAYFIEVAATATRLDFSSLRWADAEAVALAEALPFFTRVTSLDLSRNGIRAEGGAALAAAIVAKGLPLLTSLSIAHNAIEESGARQLAEAVLSRPSLTAFSGIPLGELRKGRVRSLDLKGMGVGLPGALVLAGIISSGSAILPLGVPSSLTSLDLRYNSVGAHGKAALREAVRAAGGVELRLSTGGGGHGATPEVPNRRLTTMEVEEEPDQHDHEQARVALGLGLAETDESQSDVAFSLRI